MSKKLPYKLFRGFRIPKGADDELFAEAADYKPQKTDIFIVSYPKCGTTWVQHIIYLILRSGYPANSISQVISSIPFLEQDGFPKSANKILALKYHLPFQLMPYNENALYIYIARNPKDTCVSYYHFLKKLPGYQINSFDDFFEAFLEGELPYGDFVEHVFRWFEVKHLPNVLFLTYEKLARERSETIQEIARFLGFEEIHNEVIDGVLKYSSFDFMKSLAEGDAFMQQYLKSSTRLSSEADQEEDPKMMRKGVVGDWRNFFSKEKSHRMNLYLQSRPEGADLMNLWKKDME